MLVSSADNICKWLNPDQTWHKVGLSGHYGGIPEMVL